MKQKNAPKKKYGKNMSTKMGKKREPSRRDAFSAGEHKNTRLTHQRGITGGSAQYSLGRKTYWEQGGGKGDVFQNSGKGERNGGEMY